MNTSNTKAFTILEVITSLGLLAVGIFGVLAMVSLGFQSSKRATYYSAGSFILQQVIEDEKRKGYDTNPTALTQVPYDGGKMTFWTQVQFLGQNATYGLVKKRVTVEWNEGLDAAGAIKRTRISAEIWITNR